MTRTPDDIAARVSAAEVPDPPVNERFREYVQSTAFSLSLGRTHIRALTMIEHGLDRDLEITRWPVDENRISQLQRRGLVLDLQPEVSKPRFTEVPMRWREHYSITNAGRLVLLLLTEAGMIAPKAKRSLPPPAPPGWTDPRPRIVVTPHGAHSEPSERETQQ